MFGLLVACTTGGESKPGPAGVERTGEPALAQSTSPDQPDAVSWRDSVRVAIQPRRLRAVLVVDGSEVSGTERVIELPDFSDETALVGADDSWERALDSHLHRLRLRLEELGRSPNQLDVIIDGETRRRTINHTIKGSPRSTYHRRLRLESPERRITIVERRPNGGQSADCAVLSVFLEPARTSVDYLDVADVRNPPDEEGKEVRPRYGAKRIWEGPPATEDDLVTAATRAKEMGSCVGALVYWGDDRTWGDVAPLIEVLSKELESVAVSF